MSDMKMEEVAPLAAELVIGRRVAEEEMRAEEDEMSGREEEEEAGRREKGEEEMILCGWTMDRLVVDRFSGIEMAGPASAA